MANAPRLPPTPPSGRGSVAIINTIGGIVKRRWKPKYDMKNAGNVQGERWRAFAWSHSDDRINSTGPRERKGYVTGRDEQSEDLER